jgi:hypothetical protein
MNKDLTIENVRNAKRQTLEKKNSGWIRTGARSSRLAKQFLEVSPLQGSRCTNCFFNGDRMGYIYIYDMCTDGGTYGWAYVYICFLCADYIYIHPFLAIYAYAKKEESADRFAQHISGEICRMVTALQKVQTSLRTDGCGENECPAETLGNRLSSAWAAWGAGLPPENVGVKWVLVGKSSTNGNFVPESVWASVFPKVEVCYTSSRGHIFTSSHIHILTALA